MDRADRIVIAGARVGLPSLRKVAAAVGVSHGWINQVLASERGNDALFGRIAVAVGVPKRWISFGRPEDAPAWAKPIHRLERELAKAKEQRNAVLEDALQRRLDDVLLRRRSRRTLGAMDSTERDRLTAERDAAIARAQMAEHALEEWITRLERCGIYPDSAWPPSVVGGARVLRLMRALVSDVPQASSAPQNR